MAGSGAATVGGARRSSGARPGGSAVCPPGAAFGAAGAAFGLRCGGVAGPLPAAGGVGAGVLFCCWTGPGLGGVGGFGGAAAGGAGRCGGAAAGGGAGRVGGAAAGGAGRCGGAAAGGAGRCCCGAPLGGAPFGGAPLGGALGFPSGPSSSCACAATSGAVCAWDGGTANGIAVKAVVASSTRRSFVMMIQGLRGKFWQQADIY
jgi:hypothetical protein